LNVKYILAGFGAGSVLYAAVALLGAPVGFFYGIVGGVSFSTWMHHALPMLIGALLGRYYFGKKFGQKRWKSYAPILAAGYGCGMGLVAMVLIGFALIAKAVSPLVF
ncbi:peptide transporter, partial [candidate division KSB1 bacterium]